MKKEELKKEELKKNGNVYGKSYNNYLNCLIDMEDSDNIQLEGNKKYSQRTVGYYLNNPDSIKNNADLTPIPELAYKGGQKVKGLNEVKKNAVALRRYEYSHGINKTKDSSKDIEKIKIEERKKVEVKQEKKFKKKLVVNRRKVIKIQAVFRGYYCRKIFWACFGQFFKVLKFVDTIGLVIVKNFLKNC